MNFFGDHRPADLISEFGSPLYVYNETILCQRCRELRELSSYPKLEVSYSTKANANLELLKIIRREGLRADAMSPGEIFMLLEAGFEPGEILFVCNNISTEEMAFALKRGIMISVDSIAQLDRLGRLKPGADVWVRFNPGIGAGHHTKVVTGGKKTKFGVDVAYMDEIRTLTKRHRLRVIGINQHIGSLFLQPDTFLTAAERLFEIAEGFDSLQFIDFGGGLGIPYHKEGEQRLDLVALGKGLDELIARWTERTGFRGSIVIEPGRYVVAESGALLGTVHAIKKGGETTYAGTDLGFNVLARPVLYDAYHEIEVIPAISTPSSKKATITVVGNICESGDILAKDRYLPEIAEDDLLAVWDAGAYGYTMSSNYNLRLRPAEILIEADGGVRCIRRAEKFTDLLLCFPEQNKKR